MFSRNTYYRYLDKLVYFIVKKNLICVVKLLKVYPVTYTFWMNHQAENIKDAMVLSLNKLPQ